MLSFVKTHISDATLIAFFAISSADILESINTFAAAKVLMETDMSAEEVAKKAIKVASDICVFTNNNLNIEKI